MVQELNNGILVTPLKIIDNEKGEILHALKGSESSFLGFGEAYFSVVKSGNFKGWKKHTRMTLNLIVPLGAIRFYIVDQRSGLYVHSLLVSRENYCRLTVPPGVWLGFLGSGPGPNMLLNIASIEHDPQEAENQPPASFAHLFDDLNIR